MNFFSHIDVKKNKYVQWLVWRCSLFWQGSRITVHFISFYPDLIGRVGLSQINSYKELC